MSFKNIRIILKCDSTIGYILKETSHTDQTDRLFVIGETSQTDQTDRLYFKRDQSDRSDRSVIF